MFKNSANFTQPYMIDEKLNLTPRFAEDFTEILQVGNKKPAQSAGL